MKRYEKIVITIVVVCVISSVLWGFFYLFSFPGISLSDPYISMSDAQISSNICEVDAVNPKNFGGRLSICYQIDDQNPVIFGVGKEKDFSDRFIESKKDDDVIVGVGGKTHYYKVIESEKCDVIGQKVIGCSSQSDWLSKTDIPMARIFTSYKDENGNNCVWAVICKER